MRAFLLVITFLGFWHTPNAWAQPAMYHAGIVRMTVAAGTPFDMLVWYPTQIDEVPWRIGPFPILASRDAPIAGGPFPVVLLSHGGGPGGGSPLVLREISAYLARQGFIVVAPFHGETPFSDRVRQIKVTFEAMVTDPRFRIHVAASRLGMLGFSLGGAVALGSAGGIPSSQHLAAYCATHSQDTQSCRPGPGSKKDARPLDASSHLPLRGLVLLDPFGVPFGRDGLSAVTIPILLFRPQLSGMGEENTLALARGLPRAPKIQYVSGGHFILMDICPPLLKVEAPELCNDALGVDRAAAHADMNAQVAEFFRDTL